MNEAFDDGKPVVEVRTYRARAGQRERLMAMMRELALPVQRRLGMRVFGPFPSLEDSETFVWLRAFPTGGSRDALKSAFYDGPEWTNELEAKLMPLLDDYASVLVADDGLWELAGAEGVSTGSVSIVERLGALELEESQPVVYDRPIGLRLLYADPGSGGEHYLVHYPAGLQTRRHRHSAAHTIILLNGTMEIDGQLLPAGSYAHHPAGTVMQHGPAAGDECLFVIIFHGPFDVVPVD